MSVTAWLSEQRRSGVALLLTILVVVYLMLPIGPDLPWPDALVLTLLTYLLMYFLVTMVAFSRATEDQITDWAQRESRGTWLQRYVLGTAPGPGVSMLIAAATLPVALVWLPGNAESAFPTVARLSVGALLLISAWSLTLLSFSLTFMADNLVEDEKALDFPRGNPGWASYVYFAVAVMTTFGTTDVDVTSEEMRRTVTVNAVVAFVFNTVIVAASVAAISASR